MASKRDLVEAHSFNRRRLVTAFLSGAPGGREVEPVRYGRTIVGGVVLAGLLVAGAAVTGVLRPAVGDDWRENGLVIARESGSRFVVTDENLFPVINATSARLILATEGELRVTYVPDDTLVAEPKFQTVGIPGAPDYLTPPSLLIQDDWTACTNAEGGLRTTVTSTPTATASEDQALLVREPESGDYFLVAGSRRYPVPSGNVSASILRALEVSQDDPFPASQDWLDLLAEGEPLAALDVPGDGDRVDTPVDGLDVVGTPVDVDGSGYVLGESGLIPLSDFAYRIHAATSPYTEVSLGVGEVQQLSTQTDAQPAPQDWPTDDVDDYEGSTPCLLLQEGETPTTTAAPVLATPRTPEDAAASGDRSTTVEQGRGSLVRSTTRATAEASDTAFLVDSRGTRFAIGPKENVQDTLMRLGYESVEPAPMPKAWVDLFTSGPELTPEAASQPAAP